jgi:WD40 repeat protein
MVIGDHTDWVLSLAFSNDGKLLATADGSRFGPGKVTLWDISNGRQIGQLSSKEVSHVTCLAFRPDGRLLATGHIDSTIRLWETAKGKELCIENGLESGPVRALAFSPDGKILAVGGGDDTRAGELKLWSVTPAQ